MEEELNIIRVRFNGKTIARAPERYQYDYGQIMIFEDLVLPLAYEVHFSNASERGTSKTQIGTAEGVAVPDEYLQTGLPVYAWIFLHEDQDDGRTKYEVKIPVVRRERPSDEEPTPVEQSEIDQAIAAMQAAVEQTGRDAETAADAAESAAASAEIAEEATHAVMDMTVSATGLPAGSTPTATKTEHEGVFNINFGIPKGDKGDQGETGATGRTGPAGADGQDGVSPEVTIASITGGHSVTITDADHPGGQSFNVMDGADGQDGAPGADGQDGVSPEVTISEITGGHSVTITDADHPSGQSFNVMDGQEGQQGQTGPAGADGQDGVSPEVTISEITGGHSVTITDADHPSGQSFNVMDGADGQDGAPGADGNDGVSPEVTIASITGGHSVTITDADHPGGQSFNVMDGADGAAGSDGQDGVSPEVTISEITGGHSVTITDADHPGGQSFNVMDGTDGQDGAPGADGNDGVSPEVTIASITGGHSVTITDADHPSGQSFNVMDGQDGQQGQTGPAGADGNDGVSPEVTIASITGGHSVTITDADHPGGQSFNVMDGADGQDGAPGADGNDGVSPEVTIASITGGHSVTITDADHPGGQSFNVMDGQDGQQGQTGPAGADGNDGVSPEVTIASITGGHSVTITDADHPGGQSFNVMDGADGAAGSDGQDGVSPEVTISEITGGHSVTITDADHPGGQSFNVMDGTDGQDGAPGQDGDDGVSPAVTMTAITGGTRLTITDVDHPSGQSADIMNGADGAPGPGVPPGGTFGQYLKKASSTDYDGTWDTLGADDVGYDGTQNYAAGTAGKKIKDLDAGLTLAEDSVTPYVVGNTNTTGSTLNPGTFVWVKNHSTLSDGLYTVKTTAIVSGGSVVDTNMEHADAGGLNNLKNSFAPSTIQLFDSTAGTYLPVTRGQGVGAQSVISLSKTPISITANGVKLMNTDFSEVGLTVRGFLMLGSECLIRWDVETGKTLENGTYGIIAGTLSLTY